MAVLERVKEWAIAAAKRVDSAAKLIGYFVFGVMASAVWHWWPAEEKPAKVEQRQEVVSAAKESCDCDAGTLCTGPRGGTYCITKGGSKRYF